MTFDQQETERFEVIRRKKPILPKILIGLLIVLLVLLGLIGFYVFNSLQPVQKNSETVEFVVEDNSTVKMITQELAQDGLVKDANITYYYVKFKKLSDVKAGKFNLDKSWTIDQIFNTLSNSSAALTESAKVTIVEGDWAKDAAKKFASVTNVSSDDLIALWSNKEWIQSQMSTYPFLTDEMFNNDVRIYLEGYLAPETYVVNTDTTAEDITKQVLNQTLTVYNKYASKIAESDYSVAEIYTLASIVQYEGGGNYETLQKIASVFYNRLSINMPLQSSVTVCYAIDFDKQVDNWQACEFNSEDPSPYNTYQVQGLPPGPIENAGETAFDAVLNPAETDYLYFMADVATGEVYYAETYAEHLQNIEDHPNE